MFCKNYVHGGKEVLAKKMLIQKASSALPLASTPISGEQKSSKANQAYLIRGNNGKGKLGVGVSRKEKHREGVGREKPAGEGCRGACCEQEHTKRRRETIPQGKSTRQ